MNISLFLLLLSLAFFSSINGAPTALWIFGDSLVDNGNNNFLNTIAKANYFPYGIDFSRGPTGRFSNGKTFVDILGNFSFKYFALMLKVVNMG